MSLPKSAITKYLKLARREVHASPCMCGCGHYPVGRYSKWISGHNTLTSWEDAETRQQRLSGFLRASTKKHEARLKRLGPRKKCLCGCGQYPAQLGRKWLPGHNASEPRIYTVEGKAVLRENGRRTAAKNKASGTWHSNLGIVYPEEVRKRVSDGVKRAVFEGKLDPAANCRKAWATLPLSSKMFGRMNPNHVCGTFHSDKMDADFMHESSWELARMKALEASSTVKAYVKIPFRLSYTSKNGKASTYVPDFGVFYFDGRVVIEEVKPAKLVPFARNVLRFRALQKHCKQVGYECRMLTSLEDCEEVA